MIEYFHPISMLIRSISQNAMDNKLFEILTVEYVGIDTKTKFLDSLIRKIFVIEWFHLISMLKLGQLRKRQWINVLASGSFLVLSTYILHFHTKKPCSTQHFLVHYRGDRAAKQTTALLAALGCLKFPYRGTVPMLSMCLNWAPPIITISIGETYFSVTPCWYKYIFWLVYANLPAPK